MNKTKITQARNWWAGNYVLQRLLLAIICFIISIKKKKNWNTWTFCRLVLAELSWTIWQAPAHQQLAKQGEMLRLITPLHPKQAFFFPDTNRRIIKVEKKPLKIICPTKHQCCPLTKSLTTTSTRLLNTGCLRGNKWCSKKSLCSILACQVA